MREKKAKFKESDNRDGKENKLSNQSLAETCSFTFFLSHCGCNPRNTLLPQNSRLASMVHWTRITHSPVSGNRFPLFAFNVLNNRRPYLLLPSPNWSVKAGRHLSSPLSCRYGDAVSLSLPVSGPLLFATTAVFTRRPVPNSM